MDFVEEKRRPGGVWPWPDIPEPPGWNPDGVLGGVMELHPPGSGLELFMSREQLADAGITPAEAAKGGSGPANPSLGNVPDDGLNGIRPGGWDTPNGDSHGQSPLTIDQIDPDHLVPGRPEGTYLGDYLPHGIRTPIGPVPGYPETGRRNWRSELDDQMTVGANDFNKKYGHRPGDPLYMTPELFKSWTMEETGGSANRRDFETDPLQANKFDWDEAKREYGMYPGQQMTPMASINGGLDWLQYKADRLLRRTGGVTMHDALKAYNGNRTIDPNGLPHNENYANSILGRARSDHGGQQ